MTVGALDRVGAVWDKYGMAERDWTELTGDRTRGPESMAVRHVLRSVLAEPAGFELR